MSERTDRWRRVEQICQDALDRPLPERAAFLGAACGEDAVLRREVEALLGEEMASSAFLESPAGAVAAAVMEPGPSRLSGHRVGAFAVGPLLGAGGMGEVYRARDTRLDRDVAIKILPEAFAHDAERVARFQREAKTLASLNHSNIAAIYGLEESASVTLLVMELVEGDDLSQRIARGALPLDEALPIANQMAEALAAAHEHGIIHRDLKPANIKVRRDGVVKVLDFGLAKAMEPAGASAGHSNNPTITTPVTQAGMILGTAAYMAPEQARGRPVDKRADVWAFGAVLFEMLTGRRAFDGEDVADVLGAVMRLEPDWGTLPPDVPAPVRTLLQRCLVKEPRERVADIAAALFVLDHQAGATKPATVRAASNRRAWWVAALAAGAVLALAAVAFRAADPRGPAVEPVEFTIAPPGGTSFGGRAAGGTGSVPQLAVSPDGRYIAFVSGVRSEYQLWLRPVGSLDAKPLPGTEGSAFPFWSPDSTDIAFFAGGKLKKIAVDGGPPVTLADAPAGRGGSWSRDNVIVFDQKLGSGLFRVPSSGGVPAAVTTLADGEDAHRWPHFLPDGRHFFYTAVTGPCCPSPKPGVVKIGSITPGEPVETLLQADSSVVYASGYVLFSREQTLMAQPFDPGARATTGDAFRLRERVSTEGSRYTSVSVSQSGTLAYAPNAPPAQQSLIWFDRSGRTLGTLGEGGLSASPALSPDERRVALSQPTGTPGNLDIWLIDIARNLRSRLTSDARDEASPVWSPDGTRIALGSGSAREVRPEKALLLQAPVNENAASEILLEAPDTPARPCGPRQCLLTPSDWSPDGRFLLYTFSGGFPPTSDVWALPLFGDRQPFPVANTRFAESLGAFSPDGRWIAYVSDDTGQPNVYVQPFQRVGGRQRISLNGGRNPRWSRNSQELFYLDADGAMTAVSITTTADTITVGLPQTLFPVGTLSVNQMFSVTSDGQRFLVNARPPNTASVSPLTVIVNWTSTLEK
jgi:eukaryotic-like serine/threonine-protein kinase